ncbi:hypothetical protein NEOC84_000376|uniref:BON domain-containing protein n=1 Tax=Neochlamydia sp. AcF84 TaxID=2315858 RepID=UPI00140B6963|nr:BON domain-containing protein [Neochlamydia sp. AcF84]NGY94496.1 hypothetical protein [Neochlamydia sp. AcF84]
MKKIFLMMLLSLAFISCGGKDKSVPSSSKGEQSDYLRDKADRHAVEKTPLDQSESEADRTITQKIRQAIVKDDSLSMNAKNIRIITIDGVVTLRGPIATLEEREIIIGKTKEIPGIKKIENQLEITGKKY